MNATISFMNQFLPIGFLLLLHFILFFTQRREPLLHVYVFMCVFACVCIYTCTHIYIHVFHVY